MTFHDSGDLGRRRRPLTQQEINTTGRRIENIVGDPARSEFSDDQYNAWSERQVDRTTDINGNIVSTSIEKFKPSVTRQDLNLDGSVGDKANNAPREVFAVKKVLSKAGAFSFDPGNEPTTVANDRFKKAIRTFQAGNDLKVDGLIRSGGPTVHALGRKTMGQENGRPSGYDAADYKAATGKDGNKYLNGAPIFIKAGALGTNTTMPAVGTGSTSFGGPLELHGGHNKGEVHLGTSAKPKRPPITHRQAERKSIDKHQKYLEEKIAGWIKKMKNPFFQVEPQALATFLSKGAAIDIAMFNKVPLAYKKYLHESLKAGGRRGALAAEFLRTLYDSNEELAKKIGLDAISRAAGLWASAKRWGFTDKSFKKHGAAFIYELVSGLEKYHKLDFWERMKFKSDFLMKVEGVRIGSNNPHFDPRLRHKILETIRTGALRDPDHVALRTDREFVARLWREGNLKKDYRGWVLDKTKDLIALDNSGGLTRKRFLEILGLVGNVHPVIGVPVALVAIGDEEKRRRYENELNRRSQVKNGDNIENLSMSLALRRRFIAQLLKKHPNWRKFL